MSEPATELLAHDRQRIALRYWLLGAGYVHAAEAMEWAASIHVGQRRSGAPEFSHQIAIASHVRTLCSVLRYSEETITTAFCHDVREDYAIDDAVVRAKFGDRVADAVAVMTKEFAGVRFDDDRVFAAIAADPIASVVKLADRVHNHATMVGVFSPAKVIEYVTETRTWFLPMAKIARRRFPDQEPAHESLRLILNAQLGLLDELVRAPNVPAD